MASTSERLPRIDGCRLTKLAERTEKSAAEARDFNSKITPEHQKDFYLAGMNAIAAKFYRLATNEKSHPEEVRLYADLLLRHFEQEIKNKKTAVMLRHLELIEAKRKALEALSKDPALSDTEYFSKVREIFYPINNGADRPVRSDRPNRTGYNGRPSKEIRTVRLLENGLTS